MVTVRIEKYYTVKSLWKLPDIYKYLQLLLLFYRKCEHRQGTEGYKKGNDKWLGMRIADLDLPEGVIIAILKRKEEVIIPRGDIILQEKDSIVLGAEPFEEHEKINLIQCDAPPFGKSIPHHTK